jgi:transitional endoplasmic reticulum ATPase
MGTESVTLKVAEALQDEVGYCRGRLDTPTRNELGLSIGDIIEIHGRRREPTVAITFGYRTEDEDWETTEELSKGVIRIDGLIRRNAKVNLGDKVEVRKAQVRPAQKVSLAPLLHQPKSKNLPKGFCWMDGEIAADEIVLRGLHRRPLTKGDTVVVPGMGGLVFAVTAVQPKGIVQIQGIPYGGAKPGRQDANTQVQVMEEPVKEEELTATDVAYEDIGASGDDKFARLEKLVDMKEKGLIDDDEFQQMKKEILGK